LLPQIIRILVTPLQAGSKFTSVCRPFFYGSTSLVGQGLLIVEASRSHSDTPHSVNSPGRVISPSQRFLPNNTQHLQETDIHIPGGIRTNNPTKQAAEDPRLWLRPDLSILPQRNSGTVTSIRRSGRCCCNIRPVRFAARPDSPCCRLPSAHQSMLRYAVQASSHLFLWSLPASRRADTGSYTLFCFTVSVRG
jgi:hypothetical protein